MKEKKFMRGNIKFYNQKRLDKWRKDLSLYVTEYSND
jgi:hypothetical protein